MLVNELNGSRLSLGLCHMGNASQNFEMENEQPAFLEDLMR